MHNHDCTLTESIEEVVPRCMAIAGKDNLSWQLQAVLARDEGHAIADVLLKECHLVNNEASRHLQFRYFIIKHAFPATGNQGRCVCRQAAGTGCQISTSYWTRQIKARANQLRARCSLLKPPPLSRGQIWVNKSPTPEHPAGTQRPCAACYRQEGIF